MTQQIYKQNIPFNTYTLDELITRDSDSWTWPGRTLIGYVSADNYNNIIPLGSELIINERISNLKGVWELNKLQLSVYIDNASPDSYVVVSSMTHTYDEYTTANDAMNSRPLTDESQLYVLTAYNGDVINFWYASGLSCQLYTEDNRILSCYIWDQNYDTNKLSVIYDDAANLFTSGSHTDDNGVITNKTLSIILNDNGTLYYTNNKYTINPKLLSDPLCFTAEDPGATITLNKGEESSYDIAIVTSIDKLNWTPYEIGTTITLTNVGDKVYFKAADNIENETFRGYNFTIENGKIAASGNINTLLKADGSVLDLSGKNQCYSNMFLGCTNLTQASELPATTLADNCYAGMFSGCSSLTSAPKLPATILAGGCYASMFKDCSALTKAPELPATTLADYCYASMFKDCSALTKAPELPATTLAGSCYNSMFRGCSVLTQAPEVLPATTLVDGCYSWMFYDCTSLTSAPELPATTLANECHYRMFQNCSALTQAPALPATTLVDTCYSKMFLSCTSLTSAPKLPATELAKECYDQMFYYCTSLTQAPELPATTLANNCYDRMFAGCTSLTSAPELPATTLADYCYSGMFGSCTSLTQAPKLLAPVLTHCCYDHMFSVCSSLTAAPELPATTLADNCYAFMFSVCSSLTAAPELPATTLADNCYDGMFFECTSLTAAPELPATTLANNCYGRMFYGCSALTQAPELPATTLVDNCYFKMFKNCTNLNSISVNFSAWEPTTATTEWVNGVSSLGTFTCPTDLPQEFGESRIPTGWTVNNVYPEESNT